MSVYIGDLITEVRADTDNTDFSADSGIPNEDFLRYFNFGLQRLQALLISNNSTLFRRTVDFNITVDVDTYTIDDNVYLKENIVDVKYSPAGQESDFREIREIAESYRSFNKDSRVRAYSRRAGSILVTPIPSVTQGKLRVIYDRAIDRLDLRRGQVEGVTVTAGVLQANTLDLDAATDDDTRITTVIDQYVTVNDKDGNVTAYNIPFTAYSSTTGLFTHANHTLATGEAIAINDYITIGKFTATHLTDIDSPDIERYLQLYCALKIFKRDSSSDSLEAAKELNAVETDIVDSFKSISKDEGDIQIEDPQLLYLWPSW